MEFSQRTAWEAGENAFAARLRMARAEGKRLLDLTVSNPTECGFTYEEQALLSPLSEAKAMVYEPEPLGMRSAREAVRAYYLQHRADVPLERLCLTTSTSEAYSYLFRLLCNEGDEVLVASPSYPLFDYIARLDGVRLREYPLLYDHGWLIDMHALEQSITPRTRAIIVVHPNNPTGHFCSSRERRQLETLCAERSLALIVDEVFLDYGLPGVEAQTFADSGEERALTFVLSGLSKICALPQMKCSWIAASGPRKLVEEAMTRIEIVADTFLSMNAPVQHALPSWLENRHTLQRQIRERMSENLANLDAALRGSACERLAMDGGWTAVLRVPRTTEFADAALDAGVVVQPGGFYGLPAGRVVVSLLTPPDVMSEGAAILARLC